MPNVYQYGDREFGVATIRRLATLADIHLSGLCSGDDEIVSAVQAALDGLDSEASLDDPSLGVLAGYLQAAIEKPAAVAGELNDRVTAYTGLADACLAMLDDTEITGAGRFRSAAVEVAVAAVLCGLARVVTTSTPDTRAHAIDLAGTLLDLFSDIVEALDTIQEAFEDQDWDARYFSQTATYTIAIELMATCVRYLLRSAYDLKIEKRWILREPTAPIVIAIQEYSSQEIDKALDLLCRANALTGAEILLLPAGREIVVYV